MTYDERTREEMRGDARATAVAIVADLFRGPGSTATSPGYQLNAAVARRIKQTMLEHSLSPEAMADLDMGLMRYQLLCAYLADLSVAILRKVEGITIEDLDDLLAPPYSMPDIDFNLNPDP